ncbi:O-antigen ligase family protein [Winogradskyella poriferorum]|uniref:O-antigen ligase family protein n=1 Tax=Winogradskyella poriferorum TaxID=307627 RepID=UPI003D65E036
MIIDKIYKILLWVYPLILLWVPEELFIINRVLGAAFLALYFLRVGLSAKFPDNRYFKFGLFFFLVIAVSLMVNNAFNFINVNIAVKYVTPLIVVSYAYQFLKASFFRKIFKVYFWVFLGIWLARMVQFRFPVTQVMTMRDELWWGKAVVFGFLYAAFYFGYALVNPEFLSKKKIYKYAFIIPLFLIGGRSLLLGATGCVLIFLMSDMGFRLKRIKWFFYSSIIVALTFSLFIFNYIKDNAFISYVLGSQRSLRKESEDLTLESFSSGRTNIWEVYLDGFSMDQLLFGYGGVYEKSGYSLHNDFLEMFFYYGILAFIGYLVFFYKVYFKVTLASSNYMLFGLYAFIQIQMLFNPFTATMSTIYFLLIFIWINKVDVKV